MSTGNLKNYSNRILFLFNKIHTINSITTSISVGNSSQNDSIVEDGLNHMILIKREEPDGGGGGGMAGHAPDTTSVTPPEFVAGNN